MPWPLRAPPKPPFLPVAPLAAVPVDEDAAALEEAAALLPDAALFPVLVLAPLAETVNC